MSGLFLEGIFDGSAYPSAVLIDYPIVIDKDSTDTRQMTGLLVSEPTISSANSWGPILNDVTNLQDLASLLGTSDMWSWIGASVMCWKGTSPIKTSIEFYLINYKRGLNLEQKIKDLSILTSMTNIGDNAKVRVHGGYEPRVLETNRAFFNNGVGGQRTGSSQDEEPSTIDKIRGIKDWYVDMEKGSIRLTFGRKVQLKNMLISRLDVTPSIVEVVDRKPLYYRVSMSLTGSRPLLSTDVDDMYSF